MHLKINIKLFARLHGCAGKSIALTLLLSSMLWVSACGNLDAKSQIENFCSQVKTGEPIMNVVARAGQIDFDKYWLEKFDAKPSKGEIIGIIRPRDIEKQTENFKKLKNPDSWKYGKFHAMTQKFGYSRYVCAVRFSKDKVLGAKVISMS